MEYVVTSDESRYTAARFRAIGAISGPGAHVAQWELALRDALASSGVDELKWRKLTSAKGRLCALKFLAVLFGDILPGEGRVDVVIWDTHDERHEVIRRDDTANYERMFFHLHCHLMGQRENGSIWHLRPDEQSAIDWNTLQHCLVARGRWPDRLEPALWAPDWSTRRFRVRSLTAVRSVEEPLCQLADLFAGMAPYTRTKARLMKQMLGEQRGQRTLLSDPEAATVSSSDRERFPVILELWNRCKERALGVSFATNGYLQTKKPSAPINFWHYRPQHERDRAPTL